MEKSSKWKTTIMAVLGAIFLILNLAVPQIFDTETIGILLTASGTIVSAVLVIIAAVSAKDTIKKENLW